MSPHLVFLRQSHNKRKNPKSNKSTTEQGFLSEFWVHYYWDQKSASHLSWHLADLLSFMHLFTVLLLRILLENVFFNLFPRDQKKSKRNIGSSEFMMFMPTAESDWTVLNCVFLVDAPFHGFSWGDAWRCFSLDLSCGSPMAWLWWLLVTSCDIRQVTLPWGGRGTRQFPETLEAMAMGNPCKSP